MSCALRSLTIILGVLAPTFSHAGQEDVDRFLREYPAAAKRIVEQYEQVRGSARLRHTRTGSAAERIETASFAVDGNLRKVELGSRDSEAGSGFAGEVVCVGRDSSFVLRRAHDQSGFAIAGIDAGRARGRHYSAAFGRLLESAYSLKGAVFADLLNSDDVRVVSVEPLAREGRDLLAVILEMGEPGESHRFSLLLDPGAGWVSRHGEMQQQGSPQVEAAFDVEYATGGEVPPFPSRVRFEEIGRVTDCAFDTIESATTSPDEFTLEHYDLGPVAVPTSGRPSSRLWWIAGGATVSLLLAVAFRRFSK